MAASASVQGRDTLRYTTDFPVFQQYLDPSRVRAPPPAHLAYCLGNVAQLQTAVSTLLATAIENGQQDRVELLIQFQGQLEEIPGRVAAALGREVPPEEIELQLPSMFAPDTDSHSSSVSDLNSSSEPDGDSGGDSEDLDPCPVCFEEYPAAEMRVLLGCGQHLYCQTCMDMHLSSLINDSELGRLSCPFPGCPVKPEEYEIESLVSAQTYQKFLQFSAVASLRTETTAKWCINKDCAQPIVWELADKKVVCPSCSTEFCFDCNAAWHGARTCQEAAAAPAANDSDASLQQWMQEKGSKVKPCPRCREGIEKNDGWYVH